VYANTADKRVARLKTKIDGLKTADQLQSATEARPADDTSKTNLAHKPYPRVVRDRKPKNFTHCCNPKVAGFRYKPRNPEDSLLHKIFWENLETFLDKVNQTPDSNGLPSFVIKEPKKFSDCSDFKKGLALFKCSDCGKEKAVAFSCKTRGFCPSCGGKRMTMLAAHLTDNVIASVPMRQWVLSLPLDSTTQCTRFQSDHPIPLAAGIWPVVACYTTSLGARCWVHRLRAT